MRPGVIVFPVASIISAPSGILIFFLAPTAAILSPSTIMVASWRAGLPVPSIRHPQRITMGWIFFRPLIYCIRVF